MTERSPFEQAALDYCAPRGIPLSVFLGRIVYPGDPQWLEADTLAALEWETQQANRCSGCGQNLDESQKKDNAFVYQAAAVSCHGCQAILRASKPLDQDARFGTRYRFTRTPEAN